MITRAVALGAVLALFMVGTAQAISFVEPTSLSINVAPGTTVADGTTITISGKLQAEHAFCRNDTQVNLRFFGQADDNPNLGGVSRSTITSNGTYTFHVPITEQVRYRVWFRGKVGGVHPDIKTCQKSRSETVLILLA